MTLHTFKQFIHKRVVPFFSRHPRVILSLTSGAVALVFLSAWIFFSTSFNASDPPPTAQETPAPVLYRHPLTGIPLPVSMTLPQIFAVMIDNHEDAWPQSGLEAAGLVIEAPVESGIPRLLAFFSTEQDVPAIGPVRSARPYFLDWSNELDALYVHVGGSDDALDLIASGGTFDMNEYWYGEYFWRSRQRWAPHNVYTSSEQLNLFVQEKKNQARAPSLLYGIWLFKDADPAAAGEGTGVHVDFFPPLYTVDWFFDETQGRYRRDQTGEPHLNREGDPIFADNVIVLVADMEILDAVGRRSIQTIGEGHAFILQDGGHMEVVWRKTSQTERLRFYDPTSGQEIAMNAGVTWIEVIPDEGDMQFIEDNEKRF